VKRRTFIAGLGSAAAWPVVALAQTERMRRVAVLTNADGDASQALFAIFSGDMAKLGWVEGRNLRLDLRFGAGDAELRANAAELVTLGPDVIVVSGAPTTLTVQEKTQTIPLVMMGGGDAKDPSQTGESTLPLTKKGPTIAASAKMPKRFGG
jgi:putative ABC transport system substrate-binding protein